MATRKPPPLPVRSSVSAPNQLGRAPGGAATQPPPPARSAPASATPAAPRAGARGRSNQEPLDALAIDFGWELSSPPAPRRASGAKAARPPAAPPTASAPTPSAPAPRAPGEPLSQRKLGAPLSEARAAQPTLLDIDPLQYDREVESAREAMPTLRELDPLKYDREGD